MSKDKQAISTDSLMTEDRTFPPSAEAVARAHIDAATYQEMYDRPIKDPDGFWLDQARDLTWFKEPTVACQYTWDTAARKIGAQGCLFGCQFLDRAMGIAQSARTLAMLAGRFGITAEQFLKFRVSLQLHRPPGLG